MSTSTATTPTAGPQPPVPPAGPGTVLLRVLGVLVTLVVLATGTVAVVAQFVQREDVATAAYASVTTVRADVPTGRVEVRAGAAGSDVVVERTDRWALTRPLVEDGVDERAGVLSLRASCPGRWGWLRCRVSYRVTVPPGTRLDLTTATGSVRVDGTDGEVRATTSTGSIEMTGLRAATVTAQASTGSVELEFARPPGSVVARTSTGSVRVAVPDDGTRYAVRARTAVGSSSIRVPVDDASPHTVAAEASTGSVQVTTTSAAEADQDD